MMNLGKENLSIPPISTKRTITSNLNCTRWTQENTTTYDFGNPGPGLGQAQECGGVKLVNEIPILPSWYLDLQRQYIYKRFCIQAE